MNAVVRDCARPSLSSGDGGQRVDLLTQQPLQCTSRQTVPRLSRSLPSRDAVEGRMKKKPAARGDRRVSASAQSDRQPSKPPVDPAGEARLQAGDVAHLPLDRILDRPIGDTRPAEARHVLGLAESIAAIGLLEPLVVDVHGRLISGLNRRTALYLLGTEDADERVAQWRALRQPDQPEPTEAELRRVADLVPPLWISAPVPVRLLRINAETHPEQALAAELAENEHRAAYSPSEVKAWASRLATAGFTRSGRRGRPRKGERPLLPALSAIVGKSRQTLERILDEKSPSGQLPPKVTNNAMDASRLLRRFKKLIRECEGLELKGGLSQFGELISRLGVLERELLPQVEEELRAAQKVAEQIADNDPD